MNRIEELLEKIIAKGRTRFSESEAKRAREKAKNPVLHPVLEHIMTFLSLLRDVSSKKYQVAERVIVIIVAALIYLLWVFDAIPDFIPVIGLLDDMLVIIAAANLCARDLEKYRRWKQGKQ